MSSFAGEDFLSASLPDYAKERRQLLINISIVTILFIVILPYYLDTKKPQTKNTASPASDDSSHTAETLQTSNGANVARSPSKKRRDKRRNGKSDEARTPPTPPQRPGADDSVANGEETAAVEFSSLVSNALTLLCILCVSIMLFLSDNNLLPARTVLVAPLFTPEECRRVIEMAHAAAARNAASAQEERERLLLHHLAPSGEFEDDADADATADVRATLRKLDKTLSEPSGWSKDRHETYPTTDLNLVTDAFTAEDRAWLASKLNARLAPLIKRGFGIFRGAIRSTDMFVVRYDASEKGVGRQSLRRHTDAAHVSFNVLLNDGFEGGGTRFHNKKDKSYFDVTPEVGEVILSHSQIMHEGLATTAGTRYIFVGFNSVANRDPFTGEETGLSLFSSWLNAGWMAVRFKEGLADGHRSREIARTNLDGGTGILGNKYVLGLFSDLHVSMTWLIDMFATVRGLKVVATEDSNEYLEVMDQATKKKMEMEADLGVESSSQTVYASWFKGQQIDIDVLGRYKWSWSTREANEEAFCDL